MVKCQHRVCIELGRRVGLPLLFVISVGMGCGPSKGCPEPGLEHTNLHDLECEFTSGRRAFAKEDYQKAAQFWDAVLRSTPVTKREEGSSLWHMGLLATSSITIWVSRRIPVEP